MWGQWAESMISLLTLSVEKEKKLVWKKDQRKGIELNFAYKCIHVYDHGIKLHKVSK